MSVQKLRSQKEKKNFYRNSLRAVLWIVFTSLFLNFIFVIGIYQVLINKQEPNYYATSGIKPPIQLTARSEPNYSSQALLENDKAEDDMQSQKVVE